MKIKSFCFTHKNSSYVFNIYEESPKYLEAKATPVIYNGWDCFQFNINEEKLIGIVEKAHKLGAEVFAVDYGWMANRINTSVGLGDLKIDAEKFLNCFASLIEKVNHYGMKFGIWVEPEMVSRDSELFKNHPDLRRFIKQQ